jgi:hypothetical protein
MQAFADKNVKRKVPAGKTEITVKCITKINNALNPKKFWSCVFVDPLQLHVH